MKFEFVTSRVELAKPDDSRVAVVRQADLPLYCPRDSEGLWNSHPRVYIPVEQSEAREAGCPYCGTLYKLEPHE